MKQVRMLQSNIGISLFELIIVISIIATCTLFVLPSYTDLISKTDAETINSQLLRVINLTRSEAISRGKIITLCGSADQETCSNEWQHGYAIFSDEKKLFSAETKLKGKLHWRAFPRNQYYLQFLPTGLLKTLNGTFWYCLQEKIAWAIIINQAGRMRIAYPNSSGQIADDIGKTLEC